MGEDFKEDSEEKSPYLSSKKEELLIEAKNFFEFYKNL